MPIYVVVAALAGTNVLVLLVGSVAVQYRAGARRAAALLVTASGALFILMLVSLTLRPIAESTVAGPIGLFCHHAGELVWHALPLAGLVALWRSHAGSPASEGPPLGVPGRVIAVLVTLATVLSALLLERHLHAHRFSTLVYGALRLTLLPESVSWLNGLAVGAALAVSGYGLLSRHPGRVQLGAGVALWLAGGFAPRAPGSCSTSRSPPCSSPGPRRPRRPKGVPARGFRGRTCRRRTRKRRAPPRSWLIASAPGARGAVRSIARGLDRAQVELESTVVSVPAVTATGRASTSGADILGRSPGELPLSDSVPPDLRTPWCQTRSVYCPGGIPVSRNRPSSVVT